MEYSHQEDTFGNLLVEPLAKNCLLKIFDADYSIIVDGPDPTLIFHFGIEVLLLLQNDTNHLKWMLCPSKN